MKIAIDARTVASPPYSGFGRYVMQIVKHVPRLAPDVTFVLLLNKEMNKDTLTAMKNIVLLFLKQTLRPIADNILLPLLIRKNKIDVFHFTTNVSSIAYNCRGVLTLHDTRQMKTSLIHDLQLGFKHCLVRSYYKAIIPLSAKKAAAIITDDQESKKEIINLFGIDEEKVHAIFLGVDEIFQKVSAQCAGRRLMEKYGIRGKFILGIGAGDPMKNTEGLIKAYSLLPHTLKAEHNLVILWPDFRMKKHAHDLVARFYPEQSKIISVFNASDDDLVFFYNAAALFVSTTFYKGAYLPPLEAMACGTPVVVSALSYREAIHQSAYLIDPWNSEDVVNGIVEVLTNADLRGQLIHKGLEKTAVLTAQKVAEETLKIYKQACV